MADQGYTNPQTHIVVYNEHKYVVVRYEAIVATIETQRGYSRSTMWIERVLDKSGNPVNYVKHVRQIAGHMVTSYLTREEALIMHLRGLPESEVNYIMAAAQRHFTRG